MKTFELLTIIGSIAAVGIALGAVVIGSNANLHAELRAEMQEFRTEVGTEMQEFRTEVRTEMQEFRTEVRTEMQEFRAEVRSDIRSLETRLSAVEQRQARTEGLLEGLRDAIAAQGRREPDGENEAT